MFYYFPIVRMIHVITLVLNNIWNMFPIYDGESLDTMQIEKFNINTVMCKFSQWFPVHQSWEIGHKFNFFQNYWIGPGRTALFKMVIRCDSENRCSLCGFNTYKRRTTGRIMGKVTKLKCFICKVIVNNKRSLSIECGIQKWETIQIHNKWSNGRFNANNK